MMIQLIIIIKTFLIGLFISRFEPIQLLVEELKDNLICNIIKLLLTCSKCTTWWAGMIMFHNFYLATISMLVMMIFEKTIGGWLMRIKF